MAPDLAEEAAGLKQQIFEARSRVCDAKIYELAAELESVKLSIKVRKTLRGHLTKVYALDWSLDNRHLVSASQDSRLLVWDSYSGNKINAILLKCSWVMCCAFSPSGQLVASGGLDNVCSVFTLSDREGKCSKVLTGHDGYLSDCVFMSDKQILTSSGDQSSILWDIQTGQQITSLKAHVGEVDCLAVHDDYNALLSGSTDMTVKLWDLRGGMANQTFPGHGGDIGAVKWMPNGTSFITASDDGSSRLFDIRSDQELACFALQEPYQVGATSVACSASGRILFTGYDDFNVLIWDALKCEQISGLAGHDNRVSCLGVDKEGIALCTGSWDSFLKTWN